MKKQNNDLVNLSFLDVLMSALGVSVFLFLVVPKASIPQDINLVNTSPIDNRVHEYSHFASNVLSEKPFTVTHDPSFSAFLPYHFNSETEQKSVFNHVKTVSPKRSVSEMPANEQPIILPLSKYLSYIMPNNNKFTENASFLNIGAVDSNLIAISKKMRLNGDSIRHKNRTDDCSYFVNRPIYPCKVAFELKWQDAKNNIDLYVYKGDEFVCGKQGFRSNSHIGDWDSGKSRNKLFNNDLRTNQEAVRQFDSITTGEYRLFAHLKDIPRQDSTTSLDIQGLIYTQNDQGKESSTTFTVKLPPNLKSKQPIGSVSIQKDGTFRFNKL